MPKSNLLLSQFLSIKVSYKIRTPPTMKNLRRNSLAGVYKSKNALLCQNRFRFVPPVRSVIRRKSSSSHVNHQPDNHLCLDRKNCQLVRSASCILNKRRCTEFPQTYPVPVPRHKPAFWCSSSIPYRFLLINEFSHAQIIGNYQMISIYDYYISKDNLCKDFLSFFIL